MTLTDLAATRGTDKGDHGYCPHYEEHFAALRLEPVTLLEIGVQSGASLRMWADWFPNAIVYGIDNDPAAVVNEGRISTITCNVRTFDPDRLYDIVIDDGSHADADITEAFAILWPYVKFGGWYVVEDLAVVPPSALTWSLLADHGAIVHGEIAFMQKR